MAHTHENSSPPELTSSNPSPPDFPPPDFTPPDFTPPTSRTAPSQPAPRRLAGLDGLRGVAVLMVVISHLSSYHAELLGPAGVALFFALSGYLITMLLLREQDQLGRISLPAFYARRALRLFPSLLVVVLCTPLLLWAARDPRLPQVVGGLATAVGYVQDFASATGRFGVLPHAWSLSVEEQFYLLWPLILGLAATRSGMRRLGIARLAAAACLAAAIWHAVAVAVLSYNWTYYAPDTNAVFLLTGCALAASRGAGRSWMIRPTVAGWALVAMIVMPLVLTRVPVAGWRLSTALMFPVELLAIVVVLGAAGIPLLRTRILVWFGRISYGLYLWNYLLISLEPGGRMLTGRERLIAAGAAVGMSAASWYLVESPVLRLKRRYQRVHHGVRVMDLSQVDLEVPTVLRRVRL